MGAAPVRPSIEQVWSWLAQIPDPEIPIISVVDLGIVRGVRWEERVGREQLVVTVTPTYTGCPAVSAIMRAIESELSAKGVKEVRLERRLSPAWTTEWISAVGRQQLKEYGIAPPVRFAESATPPGRRGRRVVAVECPRCGSTETTRVSEFGSTPCKAQYRCEECLEPFDYFKCI